MLARWVPWPPSYLLRSVQPRGSAATVTPLWRKALLLFSGFRGFVINRERLPRVLCASLDTRNQLQVL